MHFHNILLKIDNFTFIVLTIIIIMPVFYLGMLFEKVKSGKSLKFIFKIAWKPCLSPQ